MAYWTIIKKKCCQFSIFITWLKYRRWYFSYLGFLFSFSILLMFLFYNCSIFHNKKANRGCIFTAWSKYCPFKLHMVKILSLKLHAQSTAHLSYSTCSNYCSFKLHASFKLYAQSTVPLSYTAHLSYMLKVLFLSAICSKSVHFNYILKVPFT